MAKPWERQDGETSKAYEAFCAYRDMGPDRSLRKVSQILNKSVTTLTKWSTPNNWLERCQAWDDEQERIARKEQINDIKKMRKRHADLATAMLVKAAKALAKIPESEIKASDVSRMVEVASRLEQKSRGDTTDAVEMREAEEKQQSPVVFFMPDNGRVKNVQVVDEPKDEND